MVVGRTSILSPDVGPDGAYIAMSLQLVDGVSVRTVVVGAVLTGEAWEDELLPLAARFKASFSSVPHVSSLVVEEECRLADFLMRDVCGGCPVTVKHVDYAAG